MASGVHQFSTQEGLNLELGQGGYIYSAPDGITVHSDDVYVAVTALVADDGAACTIFIYPVDDDMGDQDTINLPVGDTVYGRWSSVVVAADEKVIIYKGS